ncbi:histidine phosphatase family protein [Candidatus Venteria ishoeyi]|uniref:histidine phosphatase family protein n=1 Tax=Candidatus Venteria ishoeyi TaxID=1899563 RepID=UPI0025A532E2|nr:histidine phosphatase family protein [Candidatus Venteria ishoeyi]MDM8546186.1 histidine phosphatase family protein [Candidatus Venteria ishoeyi]
MRTDSHWRIPTSTLLWLKKVPADRPVALLLRHSVREPLPLNESCYHVPIIPEGRKLAIELGKQLSSRLKTLHSSPLLRCIQTSEALREGSGVEINIFPDRLLGDPGVYVLDDQQAGQHWQEQGHESMMLFLVNSEQVLSGMENPAFAAHLLVQHMLNITGTEAGIHVFVTHDSLVAATALRLLKQKITQYQCPEYLEGVFFWHEQQTICTAYRNYCY